MLLGKRPRGPIKRTTSMTGMNVDLGDVEGLEPCDRRENGVMDGQGTFGAQEGHVGRSVVVGGPPSGVDQRLMATVSPRYHKRSSGGGGDGGGGQVVIETAHFLRTCGLCKRRLAPGRHDIYMYRGDTAFCSLECREQQMKHDERKEKCSVAASKKDENQRHHSAAPSSTTATSEA